MKYRILIVLLCAIVVSCSVQKRRYQKGFYVNHFNGTIKSSPHQEPSTSLAIVSKLAPPDSCDLLEFTDGTSIKGKIATISSKQIEYYYCDDSEQIHKILRTRVLKIKHADGSTEWFSGSPAPEPVRVTPIPTITPTQTPSESATSSTLTSSDTTTRNCDRIVFRDGHEEMGSVREVGLSDVRYKLCSMLDGPDFVKPKSDIFMIHYSTGHKDVFKEEPITETPYEAPQRKKTKSSLATLSLIFAFTGLYPLVIVGGIAAIIMSLIYLNKSYAEPDIYISRKLAIAGMIIGIIVLIAWLALILFTL
jgi:hypothetical protein